jgi:hypothetical protein
MKSHVLAIRRIILTLLISREGNVMPMWEWFAFDSTAVSSAILQPAQQAIRNRDLAAWQRVYDQLSQTHYARICHPIVRLLGTLPVR